MHQPVRKLISASLASLALLAGVSVLAPTTHAAALLAPPLGVTATRNSVNPTDFTVNWKPVTGALDHYNVSVLFGGVDHVTTVPAGTTTLDVAGLDVITSYKITVSSRDVAGTGNTSSVFLLNPLVPGTPRGAVGARDAAGTTLTLKWLAPAWLGYTPLDSYRVKLVRLVDGVVVSDNIVKDTWTVIGGLDTTKQYSARVQAINSFGQSSSLSTWIGNDKPGTAVGVKSDRDVKSPSVVHVSWGAPAHLGAGPITYYEVLYGVGMLKYTMKVTTATADVPLQYDRIGYVAIRSCNDAGCGPISAISKLLSTTSHPSAAVATSSPFVLVSNNIGSVSVETRGYIGASAPYPRLVFRVFPTMGNAGYTDTQIGQNGARVLTYTAVPTGTYTVTVGGLPTVGKEVELARKVIIVGNDGLLAAQMWQVIRGSAKISGTTVDLSVAGENRVLTVKPLATPDMVFSTDATLKSGSGYGIWFRAGLDAQNRISGYTFQYDPLYGNAFIIRHWYQGAECGVPVAKTSFPAGFAVNAKHHVIVVVKGDTMWASIDGQEMFRVNSLAAAVKNSACNYPAPQGTHIGFRTWNTSPTLFENTTLR